MAGLVIWARRSFMTQCGRSSLSTCRGAWPVVGSALATAGSREGWRPGSCTPGVEQQERSHMKNEVVAQQRSHCRVQLSSERTALCQRWGRENAGLLGPVNLCSNPGPGTVGPVLTALQPVVIVPGA